MHTFSFNPKTDAEIDALRNGGLLEKGNYKFVVKEVHNQVSQSGNPMLKVKIGIKDRNNHEVKTLIDYIVATDKMIFKLKHFCETLGLEKEYESGTFDIRQCINKHGLAAIAVQRGIAAPDGGNYPDKNVVTDYVKHKDFDEKKSIEKDDGFSQDIPF